jgi:hypothetical protein
MKQYAVIVKSDSGDFETAFEAMDYETPEVIKIFFKNYMDEHFTKGTIAFLRNSDNTGILYNYTVGDGFPKFSLKQLSEKC